MKRLRKEMTIDHSDIDEKEGHDVDKIRVLLQFAKTPNAAKPDFIDRQFLS